MAEALRALKADVTAERKRQKQDEDKAREAAAAFSQATVSDLLSHRQLLKDLLGSSTRLWSLPFEDHPVLLPVVSPPAAVEAGKGESVEQLSSAWINRHDGLLTAPPDARVLPVRHSVCSYGHCFCRLHAGQFQRTVLQMFNATVKRLSNDHLQSGLLLITWHGYLLDDPKAVVRRTVWALY